MSTEVKEQNYNLCVIIVNYRTAALTIDCLKSLEKEIESLPSIKVVVSELDSGLRYGIELPDTVQLGRRVVIEHQSAIVIHGNAIIGDDSIAIPINVRTLLNFVTPSKLTIAYCPLLIPVSSSAISLDKEWRY
jgi:hypothetical protein